MPNRLSFQEIEDISSDDLQRRNNEMASAGLVKGSPLAKKQKEVKKRAEYLISLDTSGSVKTKRVIIKCQACGEPRSCTENKGGSIDYWNLHSHYVESCPNGPHIKLPKGPAKCSKCGFKGNRGQVYAHRYKMQH